MVLAFIYLCTLFFLLCFGLFHSFGVVPFNPLIVMRAGAGSRGDMGL